jgi:hypothetical protein
MLTMHTNLGISIFCDSFLHKYIWGHVLKITRVHSKKSNIVKKIYTQNNIRGSLINLRKYSQTSTNLNATFD